MGRYQKQRCTIPSITKIRVSKRRGSRGREGGVKEDHKGNCRGRGGRYNNKNISNGSLGQGRNFPYPLPNR